jgi:hypothetical protein
VYFFLFIYYNFNTIILRYRWGRKNEKVKEPWMDYFLAWQLLWISSCKKSDFTYNELTIPNGNSYDFSAAAFGNGTGGDFYYFLDAGLDKFWANNLNQRGLIDLGGEEDIDLADVLIPASGYEQQGILCVVGHVYVSLAQVGEEGHCIVFRVISLVSQNSCTIDWLYR